ncbi:hypothetical protein J2S43_008267 [Catenuloplanes nepalensis]|uniref:Uncharacterized protein n=1 Tax=Catenuloplanes nepalensis TaxID=587533 RepID=A0ABT9N8A8_9ACTN|nr:hypothetical protein [Catenuloplanes nepalensis]MDP9799755.1 hypothetical protein [Catenuloplanes nepalensis]
MLSRRSRVRLALATLLTGVLAATGLMTLRGPDVLAAPPTCENTPDSTECGLGDGNSTTQPGGGGGNPGGGGGGGGSCSWNGKDVPCFIEGAGSFNASDGCYYRIAVPQGVGTPEGMTNYYRSCIDSGMVQQSVDLADPPELVPPDPVEIANRIRTSLAIDPPAVNIAPASPGVLGLPVWMQITNGAFEAQTPPSVTEAGLTVTLVATPREARWDMGAGVVTCRSKGEAWTSDKGKSLSPSCGFPMAGSNSAGYQRADDYQVTVQTFFDIAWSTADDSGELAEVASPLTTVDYTVNELQVVNR